MKVIDGVNFVKVHYMHIWKYHNETHLYNQNMLICILYTNCGKHIVNINKKKKFLCK
jgi:hypothetical protein